MGYNLTPTSELIKSKKLNNESRDSENELRMIDDRHVESSSKKAVSNQLSDDLVSENKTEIEKMKKEIGEVSKKIFYQKNNREI